MAPDALAPARSSSTLAAAGVAAAGLVTTSWPGPDDARAQDDVWSGPDRRPAVWMRVLKPDLPDVEDAFTSTAWYLGGRFRLTDELALTAELPVGHAGEREVTVQSSSPGGRPETRIPRTAVRRDPGASLRRRALIRGSGAAPYGGRIAALSLVLGAPPE